MYGRNFVTGMPITKGDHSIKNEEWVVIFILILVAIWNYLGYSLNQEYGLGEWIGQDTVKPPATVVDWKKISMGWEGMFEERLGGLNTCSSGQ